MSATVADEKVVLFHYTLTNAEGDVIDSSEGGEPLPYLHGAGNIVPGLEKQMTGKKAGDTFKAEVEPSEGYGEKQGPGPQPISRDSFPAEMELEEGMPVMAEAPDGGHLTLWITEIGDDTVFVDTNHPLAGETLNFDIEIVRIRDANKDEIAHGHPHGPNGDEGHHHH